MKNKKHTSARAHAQVRHSHGTLVLNKLLPGEYNLTLEALNGFGGIDRSPVVCPFRVLAEGETVNQTQVKKARFKRRRVVLCLY